MKTIQPNRISIAFFFLFISLLFMQCSEDDYNQTQPEPAPLTWTWNQVGLDGLKVNRLVLVENKLYAVTNDGLYTMDVDTENEFSLMGLKGNNLLDIVLFERKSPAGFLSGY